MSYTGSTKNLCAYIAQSNTDTTQTLSGAYSISSLKVHKNGAHVFGNGATLPTYNNEIRVLGASIRGTGSGTAAENTALYCSNTSNPSRACSQLSGNWTATASLSKSTSSYNHNIMTGVPSVITGKVSTSTAYPTLVTRSVFTLNFVLKD
jgi:hypothetical protein